MSAETKQVIDPARVLTVQGEPNPAPPLPKKKVFKFVKTMTPAQKLTLRSGEQITFRIPRTNTGGYASAGSFETEDEKMANHIRALAKNGSLYIFETTPV